MLMNTVNSNTIGFKAFFDAISQKEATENDILGFLAGKGLSMFFKFKDKNTGKQHLYGSNEDDRIAYSIMKNPRKEDPVDKYEYFGGVDLEAAVKDPSNMQQRPFTKGDIPSITIIEDKKDVAKELAKIKDAKTYIPYEDSGSSLTDRL
jgi:hypothetical protein